MRLNMAKVSIYSMCICMTTDSLIPPPAHAQAIAPDLEQSSDLQPK